MKSERIMGIRLPEEPDRDRTVTDLRRRRNACLAVSDIAAAGGTLGKLLEEFLFDGRPGSLAEVSRLRPSSRLRLGFHRFHIRVAMSLAGRRGPRRSRIVYDWFTDEELRMLRCFAGIRPGDGRRS